MEDKIFELLFKEDEITWQALLYDLVKTEQMDPWDVNISLLTQKYIDMLKKLKEMDFRISGKVLLAAAILLKIKSDRLVGEDLNDLDRLFAAEDDAEYGSDFYDNLEEQISPITRISDENRLVPRTPQPRERKVSIYDLVAALNKALEVSRRRIPRIVEMEKLEPPNKSKDISKIINELYLRIDAYFKKQKEKLTFAKLVPSASKQEKINTFIPLLHLTNQRKIDMVQHRPFGDIEIMIFTPETTKTLPNPASK